MKQIGTLKIITVGNSGSEDYPGNFTREEEQLIKDNMVGKVLHLFSGRSPIGEIRVDFSQDEATIKSDVFEYLRTHQNEQVDTVVLDPPYNDRFADKYDKVNKSANKDQQKQFVIFANSKGTTELFTLIAGLKPKRIIMKSWQYYNFSTYGYKDVGSYMCYAGGYMKPTFLMICEKNDEQNASTDNKIDKLLEGFIHVSSNM